MWEWVFDWYNVPYVDPCSDCVNLTTALKRVMRGGGFSFEAPLLVSSYRHRTEPAAREVYLGARCARQP